MNQNNSQFKIFKRYIKSSVDSQNEFYQCRTNGDVGSNMYYCKWHKSNMNCNN